LDKKAACMWSCKSFGGKRVIWHLWSYFPFSLWEFSYHPYKGKSKVFYISEFFLRSNSIMKLLWSFGGRKFWRFILECKMVCGQLFHTKHLVIQHCVNELYFLHFIGGGMSHHQQTWKIWTHVMILVHESQKWKFVLHDLCISICVY
jgi:hypothetical protein